MAAAAIWDGYKHGEGMVDLPASWDEEEVVYNRHTYILDLRGTYRGAVKSRLEVATLGLSLLERHLFVISTLCTTNLVVSQSVYRPHIRC